MYVDCDDCRCIKHVPISGQEIMWPMKCFGSIAWYNHFCICIILISYIINIEFKWKAELMNLNVIQFNDCNCHTIDKKLILINSIRMVKYWLINLPAWCILYIYIKNIYICIYVWVVLFYGFQRLKLSVSF